MFIVPILYCYELSTSTSLREKFTAPNLSGDEFWTYLGRIGKVTDSFSSQDKNYFTSELAIDNKTGKVTVSMLNKSDWALLFDLNDNFEPHCVPHKISCTEINPDGSFDNIVSIVNTTARKRVDKNRIIALRKNEYVSYSAFDIWDTSVWEDMLGYKKTSRAKKFRLNLYFDGYIVPQEEPLKISPEAVTVVDKNFISKMERLGQRSKDESPYDIDNVLESRQFDNHKDNLFLNVNVDNKNADVIFSISCIGKGLISFDIDAVLPNSTNIAQLKYELFSLDNNVRQNLILNTPLGAPVRKQEEISETEKFVRESRNIVICYGETIGATVKIWDIPVWDEVSRLVNEKENQRRTFFVEIPIEMMIDGHRVVTSFKIPFNYRVVRDIEKIRKTQIYTP
jgi:hypothetical protein